MACSSPHHKILLLPCTFRRANFNNTIPHTTIKTTMLESRSINKDAYSQRQDSSERGVTNDNCCL
jgi:hypothetical protein